MHAFEHLIIVVQNKKSNKKIRRVKSLEVDNWSDSDDEKLKIESRSVNDEVDEVDEVDGPKVTNSKISDLLKLQDYKVHALNQYGTSC